MSVLTGTIKINGTDWGYASKNFPVEAWWTDDSIYTTYDDGHEELDESLHFLEGRFGFEMASATDLAQLKALTGKPFPLILRSKAAGDPNWPVLEAMVRRTNRIEETGPLFNRDMATGESVYQVVIEFRSTHGVEHIPGVLEGGFSLVPTEIETIDTLEVQAYDLQPWGIATAELKTFDAPTPEGGTVELQYYELGPPELVELLVTDHPTDPHALLIDTTGTYRLGTTPSTE